jgi:hypothetical protein
LQKATGERGTVMVWHQFRMDIYSSLGVINSRLGSIEKRHILAAAIQNSEYNVFRYNNGINDSRYIVRQILFAFQQGLSFPLPTDAIFVTTGNRNDSGRFVNKELAKQHFREKLVDQIHQLTGVKPVVKKEDNDQYVVYYSDY